MILQERDDYEKKLADLARAGKLGWSSGTAAHLVEREPEGKAYRITRWPLGLDASLTHTPAEPRNGVMALKSLFPKGEITMEKEELVAILDGFKTEVAKVAAESADTAVKKFADELAPEVKAGYAGRVEVSSARAARPVRRQGDPVAVTITIEEADTLSVDVSTAAWSTSRTTPTATSRGSRPGPSSGG